MLLKHFQQDQHLILESSQALLIAIEYFLPLFLLLTLAGSLDGVDSAANNCFDSAAESRRNSKIVAVLEQHFARAVLLQVLDLLLLFSQAAL